jgi:hypothetical protein
MHTYKKQKCIINLTMAKETLGFTMYPSNDPPVVKIPLPP